MRAAQHEAPQQWHRAIQRRYTGAMNLPRVTLLALICAATPVVALAQWQWVEKDGRKVFSDQPPPSSIPAKDILRQPGGKAPAAADAPKATAAPASAAAAVNTPKLSGLDKELAEKKKRTAAAEAEKKKAQEEEHAKVRADNCARAKRAKAGLDSGMRIARANDKGEREFLDDAQRAAEAKRTDMIIARECTPAG